MTTIDWCLKRFQNGKNIGAYMIISILSILSYFIKAILYGEDVTWSNEHA